MLLLATVVVASGCIHNSSTFQPPQSDSQGQGLQVERFDISDQELNPGQQGLINLELKSYHSQDIQIDDISIYNTGILEVVESKECSPSDSEIQGMREDYVSTVECRWTVEVDEEDVENFESRTVPVKLNLAYNSSLSNSDNPVKIHFQSLDQIDQTNEVQETFSNSEVEMDIETDSPVQFSGSPVTVTVRNSGVGRIDSDYGFEYTPESVLESCPSSKEPLVESEASFTCDIEPQSETDQTRNLVFSTSYKYVKAPTLDVEVVNPK